MVRMKFAAVCLTLLLVASGHAQTPNQAAQAGPRVQNPVVVQFMIDGIDSRSVRTAVASGATALGDLMKQSVVAEQYYCTSPAPRLELPDGSLPWGGSTSSNVAMHTGTHLFESRKIDDIFLSARRAGVKSVFAGGSPNYVTFDKTDYLYYGDALTDQQVIDRGLQHFQKDG